VKLKSGAHFVGRQALERQQASGLKRRRVNILLTDPDVILLGTEPLVVNGEYVGQVMSTAYGHTVGGAVGIGLVRLTGAALSDALEGARWEVEVARKRHAVHASLRAFHDPAGLRPRADG
jgi:4-methylaminobutanoate oxidase (formaldehyde-forming)